MCWLEDIANFEKNQSPDQEIIFSRSEDIYRSGDSPDLSWASSVIEAQCICFIVHVHNQKVFTREISNISYHDGNYRTEWFSNLCAFFCTLIHFFSIFYCEFFYSNFIEGYEKATMIFSRFLKIFHKQLISNLSPQIRSSG